MRPHVLHWPLLLLTLSPKAVAQTPAIPPSDSSTTVWSLDSSTVDPVFGKRRYSAALTGTGSGGLMLLVCDAQRRLYIQFFTRPVRRSAAPLVGGVSATHVAYRFDTDDPIAGRIVWQEDQPDVGNAMWPSGLRRLGGLDNRGFWRALRAGRILAMTFQGRERDLVVQWVLPSNTESVIGTLRDRCRD
jgi:hypothetical protein